MASLAQDIKNGNIARMYLFYGEEAFKKRHFKELLKQAVSGGNMMNYSAFEGRNIDWQEVYDATQTLPFFASKRLVIVENSGKFKAGKAEDDNDKEERAGGLLEKILTELPESTTLAFFEESAAKNKKIYKIISSGGIAAECSADTEEQLVNWLARGFAKEGKKIRRSTLELLIGRCGLEYDKLRTEFEKIVSYAGEKPVIEDSDIVAITAQTTESRIFDMLSAMSEKNIHRVLQKYHDLLENKEHPLYILAMLRNQFRTMLQVQELLAGGMNAAAAAKTAGKPVFVVNNMKKYLRNFSGRDMEQILEEISETDRRCKVGEITDQIGVELLLIRFSQRTG